MKYFEEYGKKLTHRHAIQIRGDKVWDLYFPDATVPFDPWIKTEVRAWLDELPPHPKYSWMPRWSPYKPLIPAYTLTRPFTVLKLVIAPRPGYPEGYGEESVAVVRFARKDDAMKFKLTWA